MNLAAFQGRLAAFLDDHAGLGVLFDGAPCTWESRRSHTVTDVSAWVDGPGFVAAWCRAFRITLPDGRAYWTVVDAGYEKVVTNIASENPNPEKVSLSLD